MAGALIVSGDTTSSFHLRDSNGVQGQLDVKLQPFDKRASVQQNDWCRVLAMSQ